MKNAFLLVCLAGLSVHVLGCDEGDLSEKESDNLPADEAEKQYGPIVSPLFLSYRKWDYHLMQGLPDHPVFEMVELMVDGLDTEHPKIWFFSTEREVPKHQVHYVNDGSLVEYLSNDSIEEEIILTLISLEITESDNGILNFDVALEDAHDSSVWWHFETTAPLTAQYANFLVDQSGHDLDGGILVMFAPISSTSNNKTRFENGGLTYPIAVWEEYSGSHYTTYHGACTQGLSHGYLGTGHETIDRIEKPTQLTPNALWRQLGPEQEHSWEVKNISEDTVVVIDQRQQMTLLVQENHLDIVEIRNETEKGYISILFDPAVPDLSKMSDGASHQVSFSIDIDNHEAVIHGTATAQKEGDTATLVLAPKSPDWAVANEMHVTIEYTDKGYTLDIKTVQL